MGLHSGITPVPAIALGGLEGGVTPLEMAEAYATLAAGGKHAEPFGISEVRDAKGAVLFSAKPKAKEAIDPAVAYLTTDILKGVIKRGTGTSSRHRTTGGREDGHDPAVSRRVVRRLHAQSGDRRLDGLPRGTDRDDQRAWDSRDRRFLPCPDVGQVHARGASGQARSGLHSSRAA